MPGCISVSSSSSPHKLPVSSDIRRYILRGTLGVFVLKIIGALLSLVSTIVLARLLGASGYGVYGYAMAWVGLLAVLSPVGFPRLIVRELATIDCTGSHGSWSKARGLLRTANFISSGVAVLLSIGVLGTLYLLPDLVHPQMEVGLAIAVLILPLQVLTMLRLSALQGLKKILMGQMLEILVHPFFFLALLTFAWLLFGSLITAFTAIKLHIVASAILLGLAVAIWRYCAPPEIRSIPPSYEMRHWLSIALPLLFMSLMMVINNRADILMLGTIKGSEEVGIYSVTARAAEVVAFVIQAMNVTIAPVLASVYRLNDRVRLQRIVAMTTRVTFAVAVTLALLIYYFGEFLLSIFGLEFIAGYQSLRILVLGQVVNAFMGAVGVLLMMTGHERQAAVSAAVAACINITANAVLIPRYGMEGAAVATAISMVIWNGLMGYYVFNYLKIIPSALGPAKVRKGA